MVRNNYLSWFGGLWVGFEVITRDAYFRKMALGWRALSFLGIAGVTKGLLMSWSSNLYAPTLGAFFRKYQKHVANDAFEIKDDKKQYFYIDTSSYMNYSNETLGDEYHCHHGPQPDDDYLNSSYLTEVDKFLRGEDNNLKGHKRYLNYEYELLDKSFPTAEATAALMHGK